MANAAGGQKPEVHLVKAGNDRLTMIFPKGMDLHIKRTVSVEDVVKLLGVPEAEVEGQGDCNGYYCIGCAPAR